MLHSRRKRVGGRYLPRLPPKAWDSDLQRATSSVRAVGCEPNSANAHRWRAIQLIHPAEKAQVLTGDGMGEVQGERRQRFPVMRVRGKPSRDASCAPVADWQPRDGRVPVVLVLTLSDSRRPPLTLLAVVGVILRWPAVRLGGVGRQRRVGDGEGEWERRGATKVERLR